MFWKLKKNKLIFFPLFRHLGILELARLVNKEYDQIFPLVKVEPVRF